MRDFKFKIKGKLISNNKRTSLNSVITKIQLPEIRGKSKLLLKVNTISKWFYQNAEIHFLVPHGLEQYDGGGWGTRDVTQGPFELFLSLGYYDIAKIILKKVFENQNIEGDWHQW